MATVTEERRLQLPAPLFRALLTAATAARSSVETATLLRQAGYDAGEAFSTLLDGWIGERQGSGLDGIPAPTFWAELSEFWQSLGWGSLEHRQVRPGIAELVSTDWAEAGAAAPGAGCQLTTGLFADVLTRVAGEDVALLEVECRSRGDDRCRFLLGSPAALAGLYESLRAGSTLEAALEALG